jgi:hypothetical protein
MPQRLVLQRAMNQRESLRRWRQHDFNPRLTLSAAVPI